MGCKKSDDVPQDDKERDGKSDPKEVVAHKGWEETRVLGIFGHLQGNFN